MKCLEPSAKMFLLSPIYIDDPCKFSNAARFEKEGGEKRQRSYLSLALGFPAWKQEILTQREDLAHVVLPSVSGNRTPGTQKGTTDVQMTTTMLVFSPEPQLNTRRPPKQPRGRLCCTRGVCTHGAQQMMDTNGKQAFHLIDDWDVLLHSRKYKQLLALWSPVDHQQTARVSRSVSLGN